MGFGHSPDPGRAYAIVNRATGLVLDVPGGSKTQGATLDEWANTGDDWEKWTTTDVGGGYYSFTNVNSKLVLDDTGNSQASGNVLEQYADLGRANEQWQPSPTGDGYYRLVNRSSGLAAAVIGSHNGGAVVQSNSTGTDSQWSFVRN